jgi:hypothetical protein
MISQSLITEKISELVIEAQTGVKRPRMLLSSGRPHDSVTISEEASVIQHIVTALEKQDDEARAAYVGSVKERVASGGFAVSDEMAEKIARRILGLNF